MNPAIPYFACVLGSAALYLLLRPNTGMRAVQMVGSVLGLGSFGWLLVEVGRRFGVVGGEISGPGGMFVAFSLIAVASAVRMITHSRPVYSALYFVMVVLSSAGMFLLLQAEFMAFALVIVYAGAILITYMFVLMLAQQAPTAHSGPVTPEYDRLPREPGLAAMVGFMMLALFTHMIVEGGPTISPPVTLAQANQDSWLKLKQLPGNAQRIVDEVEPGAKLAPDWNLHFQGEAVWVDVVAKGATQPSEMKLPAEAMPSNVQLVGLDLVSKFPVSLELAGIILLLAMFGAVVLARKQIELGEDEVREAAGMRRLAFHSDDHPDHAEGTNR